MATVGRLTALSWRDLERSDRAADRVVEALADFGGVLLRDCPAQRQTPPAAPGDAVERARPDDDLVIRAGFAGMTYLKALGR